MCRHFLFLCSLILLTLPCLAVAHHGFDPHYDRNQTVLIEGTITKFEYVNPHSFVYVEVTNDGDTVEHWCEMQASSQLRIKGIYPDFLPLFESKVFRQDATLWVANSAEATCRMVLY